MNENQTKEIQKLINDILDATDKTLNYASSDEALTKNYDKAQQINRFRERNKTLSEEPSLQKFISEITAFCSLTTTKHPEQNNQVIQNIAEIQRIIQNSKNQGTEIPDNITTQEAVTSLLNEVEGAITKHKDILDDADNCLMYVERLKKENSSPNISKDYIAEVQIYSLGISGALSEKEYTKNTRVALANKYQKVTELDNLRKESRDKKNIIIAQGTEMILDAIHTISNLDDSQMEKLAIAMIPIAATNIAIGVLGALAVSSSASILTPVIIAACAASVAAYTAVIAACITSAAYLLYNDICEVKRQFPEQKLTAQNLYSQMKRRDYAEDSIKLIYDTLSSIYKSVEPNIKFAIKTGQFAANTFEPITKIAKLIAKAGTAKVKQVKKDIQKGAQRFTDKITQTSNPSRYGPTA
ncbi:MAG: hypothetical protein H6909_00835 [Rickettsiaceae bacterium]|nr:hypothetical protein [Rickettsiaceae bacterium]